MLDKRTNYARKIVELLQALFSLLHINIDIDVERDINDIRVFHLDSSDVE